jgi:hypothetical protein
MDETIHLQVGHEYSYLQQREKSQTWFEGECSDCVLMVDGIVAVDVVGVVLHDADGLIRLLVLGMVLRAASPDRRIDSCDGCDKCVLWSMLSLNVLLGYKWACWFVCCC